MPALPHTNTSSDKTDLSSASVFDLIPKEDKTRIEATKQAVAITQSLTSKASTDLGRRLLASQDSLLETVSLRWIFITVFLLGHCQFLIGLLSVFICVTLFVEFL